MRGVRLLSPRRVVARGIGIVVLLFLLVVVVRVSALDALTSGVVRVVSPVVLSVRHAVGEIAATVQSFIRVARLSRAVRILEEENTALTARVVALEGVEEENRTLRQELALLPRETTPLVTAEVVGRSTDGVSESLVINRGSEDGIRGGLPVIVRDGVVVGHVQSVKPYTAILSLLTNPAVRLAAATQETGAAGVIRGERGVDIVLETVPRTARLEVGHRVVTTGADGVFPPHLLIGTIHAVDAPENEIFQSARVRPAVNLHRLQVVSVLLTE